MGSREAASEIRHMAIVADETLGYIWSTREDQLLSQPGYLTFVEPALHVDHATTLRHLGASVVTANDKDASVVFLKRDRVVGELLTPGTDDTPGTVAQALIYALENS